MKAEEILTLVRAGFTRADLAALGVVQSGDKPVEKPADKPAEKPADKPVEKPADKPADKPVDVASIVSQAVAATVAEMQKNNMIGAAQPKTESVDDILAQIIAPNGGAK